MHERPLTDRRPHDHGDVPWEVRAWSEPPGPAVADRLGWRSLAWSDDHDDAVVIARALTGGPAAAYEYAEVRGPERSCERFPTPDADERREMWLSAATETYSSALGPEGAPRR